MRFIGFDHVIDYTKEDFTKKSERYDLILDNKINRRLFDYLRVLNPKGSYVTTGGESNFLMQAFLLGPIISIFTKKRICVVMLKPNKNLDYINKIF